MESNDESKTIDKILNLLFSSSIVHRSEIMIKIISISSLLRRSSFDLVQLLRSISAHRNNDDQH